MKKAKSIKITRNRLSRVSEELFKELDLTSVLLMVGRNEEGAVILEGGGQDAETTIDDVAHGIAASMAHDEMFKGMIYHAISDYTAFLEMGTSESNPRSFHKEEDILEERKKKLN